MAEVWKPIPGYEGYYSVSDQGRVYTHHRDKIMAPAAAAQKGYPMVRLCREGRQKKFYVHALVALAFIGPRPKGLQVMHLDDVPANNCAGNLRYGTQRENLAMSDKVGRNSKLREHHVAALRSGEKTCAEIAREAGVSYSAAWSAKTGKNWGAGRAAAR